MVKSGWYALFQWGDLVMIGSWPKQFKDTLGQLVTVPEFLPPANEVCEGYVFTPVSQSFC